MKFVKINPSRGYGDDVWEVISENCDVYSIVNVKTRERKPMHKSHTYFDRDCVAANRAYLKDKVEAAKSIGKPKRKPGKKK